MRKGYSILFVVLLVTNSLLILSPFISAPVKALDYGKDHDLGNVDASFWGEDGDDYSGRTVVGAGDVNGDGYDDILIGAYGDDDGGRRSGQTYLILGEASGWSMDRDLSTSDASFWGEDEEDQSGWSVSGAGDVNGDGFDDILIGARVDNDGGLQAGQTYLILGKASGWTMDTDLSASDASFWGEEPEDFSGSSVTGAGDVNGDGYDDILIGAHYNDHVGEDAGQTYLIFGKASGWAMDTDLSASDASFLGEDQEDRSGLSVSGAGDVNGDGYDDVLIGAYLDDDGGSAAGQTYLILGKATGWTMDTDLSASDASFWGEDADDNSGRSVSGAGDVNGDGYDDILIGAWGDEDGGGNYAGQTYLILGKPSGWFMDTDLSNADASFWGEDANDHSGYTVAGAGDVNGDGYDDILIGAYFDYDGGRNAGQTYLILGKGFGWAMDTDLSASDASFWGEDADDHSGFSIAGTEDVNGDGYDDILIGASSNDDGGNGAGQTYLIFPDHNSVPTSITSVKAYSDNEYTHETTSGEQGEKIYLELQGNDGDARKNIAQVWVKGSSNPKNRFRLRLLETGANTGKFRGSITIANRTHKGYHWINASEGGWVQITSRKDPTKFVNLTIGQPIDIEPKLTIVHTLEDAFFTQQFEANGIIPDSWSFDTNSSWLAWNSGTVEIFGTPDNSHVGTYWAELKAEAVEAKGVLNFTIQVNNTKPVITTSNVPKSNEGLDYVVDYNSSDDNQGTITWHLNTDASWLHLNDTSGILNGTPQQSDVGNYTVNISVDDGNGGWDFTEFTLRVSDVNDPPILENFSITPDPVRRGDTSTIYIQPVDPESGTDITEPLVEAKGPSSDWMKINCSYNFEGDNFTAEYIPLTTSGIGRHSFRIKLTDKGNVSSGWYYFNNSLTVKNSPPVIHETFENISVYNDKNTLVDLVSYASDYEDLFSELSWEVVEYSPTSLFDAYMKNETVVEIWPATAGRTGLGKIHFKVKDSDQGIVYKNITVEILNGTEKPNLVISLESPENSTIINTETINLTWSTDGYSGPLTFDIHYGDSIDKMTLEFPDVQNTTVKLMGLEDNTTYYWKITAMIDGVPTVFESEIWQFTVMKEFESDELEIDFDVSEVTVRTGERVTVNLILTNITTGPITVDLAVEGELKEFITINNKLGIVVDAQKTISVHIFGDSSLEPGNYTLVIRASFSGQERTAELTVKVEESPTSTSKEGMGMWLSIVIVVILTIVLLAVFLVIFLRSKKKKKEDGGEMLDAEIEATPQAGITTADLNLLSLGETQGRYVDFQGRLSETPLQYKLPDQTSPYQHKSLAQAPAPQVTLPQLKVTGDHLKEPPKALPQMSVVPATGVVPTTTVPPPTLPISTPVTPADPQEPPALPMVGSVPTAPITPSVTIPPPTPTSPPPAPPEPSTTPLVPPVEPPPLPPPAPFSPEETGIKLSHDSVKNASVFRIDEPMPCSICYGEISSGLQASRCSCGNISHLSCGIKIGKCSVCGEDYEGMINRVSQEAIVKSVEDSKKTAKREVEVQVEWDEKGDMMKGLLKKLLNNEITVEQYEKISNDIRESF